MAKRVRRRRSKAGQFTKSRASSNPRRRRRRRTTHHATARANPPRRRRRHHSNPTTRRRHRRNPDLISVVGSNALKGAIGGAGVVVGETLGRKIRGAVQGMLPASTNVSSGLPGVATSAAAALAVTVASALAVPAKWRRFSEFVAAGAWAETWNQALAQTPIAPYLAAVPRRRLTLIPTAQRAGVRAYPQLPRQSVAAYPPRTSAYPRAAQGI